MQDVATPCQGEITGNLRLYQSHIQVKIRVLIPSNVPIPITGEVTHNSSASPPLIPIHLPKKDGSSNYEIFCRAAYPMLAAVSVIIQPNSH